MSWKEGQPEKKPETSFYDSPPSFHYAFKNPDARTGCQNTHAAFTTSVHRGKNHTYHFPITLLFLDSISSVFTLTARLLIQRLHLKRSEGSYGQCPPSCDRLCWRRMESVPSHSTPLHWYVQCYLPTACHAGLHQTPLQTCFPVTSSTERNLFKS